MVNYYIQTNNILSIVKIEDETRNTGRSWNAVKGIGGNRNAWKLFMDALCSTKSKRN